MDKLRAQAILASEKYHSKNKRKSKQHVRINDKTVLVLPARISKKRLKEYIEIYSKL